MRLSVDSLFLRDPRVKRLAMLVKRHERHVRGDLLEIWEVCFLRRTALLEALDIDAQSEAEGYADAMVRAGLATETPDGIRVHGVEERLSWLLAQDEKRSKANAVRNGKRDNKELPRGAPEPVPRDIPGEFPSEICDLGSGISDERDARAIPPPPIVTTPGALPPPASATERTAARRAVERDHVERFAKVRDQLGIQVPALNLTGEGERWLVDRLKSRGDTSDALAAAVTDCLHVLEVRERQAVKSASTRYFGATVWRPDEFAWALQRTPADFDRTASARAGPHGDPQPPKRQSTKFDPSRGL